MFFRFGKQRQGFLPRGAVDAVPGRFHHPLTQLRVGVGQGAELPQGDKAVLDIFYPGLHSPFFLGSRGGQGEIKKP